MVRDKVSISTTWVLLVPLTSTYSTAGGTFACHEVGILVPGFAVVVSLASIKRAGVGPLWIVCACAVSHLTSLGLGLHVGISVWAVNSRVQRGGICAGTRSHLER